MRMTGSAMEQKGVSVTSDQPVTVQVSNAVYDSADAYLALPVHAANTVFLIPSYRAAKSYQNSFLAVVGTEANTAITVSNGDGATIAEVTLGAHDTHQWLLAGSDLSGARVTSTKPISVLAGNDYTYIPSSSWCCADHMAVQVPPMTSHGSEFIAAPILGRAYQAGFHIRVYAAEDNTEIETTSLNETQVIERGEYLDYGVLNMTTEHIKCSKKCMVAQFNQGSQVDITQTDPFMMLLPPVDQYSNSFLFATPVRFDNSEFTNYVSVVASNLTVAGGILFDNALIYSNWTTVNNTDYVTTGFSAEVGVHLLRHPDASARFTGFVYGHADIHTEAYGHALGYGKL